MTKIKICGITNLKDALMAVDAGADALGFIFAPSPRRVSPERVREMVLELPPFVCTVGIFMNEELPMVKEVMEYCLLDLAQFHGEEDVSYLKAFGKRGIKVFKVGGSKVLEEIRRFRLPFFMLDLPKGDFALGYDWDVAREAGRWGRVILAGRLTPENVEFALSRVSPYGVDVCRGVEEKEGVKNPDKLKEFILKVRKWDLQRS